MEASIIIPTYKRQVYIIDVITGLINQDYCKNKFEILVIDNSEKPTADLINICNSYSSKLVRYIHEPRCGLHFSRHTGAKLAAGEILIYLDDDVIVGKQWLKNILVPYEDPNVFCVGGKVVPRWECEVPDYIQQLPVGYFSLLDYGEKFRILQADEYLNGCNFSIRKQTLFDVGGFNPDGFGDRRLIYLRGDGEYGLIDKIRAHGFSVHYSPDAWVEHRINAKRVSEKSLNQRAFSAGIDHSYTFFRKCCPSLITLWVHFAKYIGRFCYYSIVKTFFKRTIRDNLAWSMYKGILYHMMRLLFFEEFRDYCCLETYWGNE